MTQKEKNNLDKKNKIKKIVFKVLHVIGYICTLFTILLCIGLGVSSCDNKQHALTQSQSLKVDKNELLAPYTEDSSYFFLNAELLYNVDFIDSFYAYFKNLSLNDDTYYSISSYIGSNALAMFYGNNTFNNLTYFKFYTSNNQVTLYFSAGTATNSNRITLSTTSLYGTRSVTSTALGYSNTNLIFYRITSINSNFRNFVINFCNFYTDEDLDNAYSEGYEEGYSIGYEEGYSIGYDDGFENFILPVVDTEVSINYNYDFRKWYATEIDYNSGILLIDSLNSLATYNTAEVFQFYVGGGEWYIGGKKYNGVVSSVLSLTEDNYLRCADNSHNYVSHFIRNSNLKTFGYLYTHYVYFDDTPEYTGWKSTLSYNYLANSDYSLKVQECYTTGFTGAEEGSLIPTTFIKICDINWTDSGFRFLKFYSSENNYVSVPNYSNNLTLLQLLSLNDESIVTANTAYANVMTMLSSAFNGLANLLIIPILPNITLGILLFLPLVVGVIVIIIKMLRK